MTSEALQKLQSEKAFIASRSAVGRGSWGAHFFQGGKGRIQPLFH